MKSEGASKKKNILLEPEPPKTAESELEQSGRLFESMFVTFQKKTAHRFFATVPREASRPAVEVLDAGCAKIRCKIRTPTLPAEKPFRWLLLVFCGWRADRGIEGGVWMVFLPFLPPNILCPNGGCVVYVCSQLGGGFGCSNTISQFHCPIGTILEEVLAVPVAWRDGRTMGFLFLFRSYVYAFYEICRFFVIAQEVGPSRLATWLLHTGVYEAASDAWHR